MLVYDVFHFGRTFDRSIPLPSPAPEIRYAQCRNGRDAYLVPRDGRWQEVSREEALARRDR